jgi:hypothetical protein
VLRTRTRRRRDRRQRGISRRIGGVYQSNRSGVGMPDPSVRPAVRRPHKGPKRLTGEILRGLTAGYAPCACEAIPGGGLHDSYSWRSCRRGPRHPVPGDGRLSSLGAGLGRASGVGVGSEAIGPLRTSALDANHLVLASATILKYTAVPSCQRHTTTRSDPGCAGVDARRVPDLWFDRARCPGREVRRQRRGRAANLGWRHARGPRHPRRAAISASS